MNCFCFSKTKVKENCQEKKKIFLIQPGESSGLVYLNDDLLMSFIPHATSKIKTEYDLFRINTLGFRGEAVASIAAVSNMQIISSTNGTDGYQATYRFGSLESSGITHSNKGTTVIVSNLFYNTPARLKYLKPAKTELASISYLLDRIALSHPGVRLARMVGR